MELGLAGKRAVVAASSAGLGYACAEALVAEGARVAICGHDAGRLNAAASRLGGEPVAITADLSVPANCGPFVREAAAALGGLDILVTNGPGPRPGTFGTTPPDAYQPALDVSLLAVVEMVYAGVALMRPNRWGRVVAITSLSVRQPMPELILSNTARAGVTGFLKTVAREVAADGITVNSVLPGLHRTARVDAVFGDRLADEVASIPAGVLGRPEDLGAVVAFLCSEQARFITGSALAVDGGADQSLV
ncbi:MAG TPA: SDR family oxidoreductase [Solirubrobacter sp.]|nr:SDR family oxidoreductase [Solirubrobacter sp.]